MSKVRLIESGEPLTPEVANRPVQDLIQWMSRLDMKISSYLDTSNIIHYNQPVDVDTHVGAPVYLNKDTGAFSPARVSTRVEGDQVIAENSCYVLGIIVKKHTANIADICLSGIVELDFTESGNQDAHYDYLSLGVRYLSNIEGRVTAKAPTVSIPVAFVVSVGPNKATIAVNISLDRILSGHRHHRLLMKARPSLNNGLDSEGWLPANSAAFASSNFRIPAGAVFGYNINASDSLRELFPLVAPESFKIFWSQYTAQNGPAPAIAEIYDYLYIVNETGIWWMDTDKLPWNPGSWNTSDPNWPVWQTTEPDTHEEMLAYYTSITYNTDDAVVTSLQTTPASGLSITCTRTGAPAIRGDLNVDLELDNKTLSEVFLGPRVLKYIGPGWESMTARPTADDFNQITDKNGFFWGPVVESVEMDSIFSQVISVDNVFTHDEFKRPSGRIKIVAGDAWSNIPLPVQSVHLDQMRDAFIGGMVALAFFPGQKSGFSGSVYIPLYDGEDATARTVRIKLTLVVGAAGNINAGMFTGRFIVIPALECDDVPRPLPMTIPSLCNPHGDAQDLQFDFSHSVTESPVYFTACSEPIEVPRGAMLWFSWHKDAGDAPPLSIIKMEAYLDPTN